MDPVDPDPDPQHCWKYINGGFFAVWPIVKIALSFIPTGGSGRKGYQNPGIWWEVLLSIIKFLPTGGLGRKEYQNLGIW